MWQFRQLLFPMGRLEWLFVEQRWQFQWALARKKDERKKKKMERERERMKQNKRGREREKECPIIQEHFLTRFINPDSVIYQCKAFFVKIKNLDSFLFKSSLMAEKFRCPHSQRTFFGDPLQDVWQASRRGNFGSFPFLWIDACGFLVSNNGSSDGPWLRRCRKRCRERERESRRERNSVQSDRRERKRD